MWGGIVSPQQWTDDFAAVSGPMPLPPPPPGNSPPPIPYRLIGGVPVAALRRDRALALVRDAIERRSPAMFGFCNAHTVNMARGSPAFASALARHVLFADGIGVDLASRLLYGSAFPENLNGTDFTPALLRGCGKPLEVFLLGSPPGVAEVAAEHLARRFPGVVIAGTQHGFFAEAESPAIVARIRAAGARLVLVGMGHPRQELWAAAHGEATGAVVMSVGAYLDFAAGRVARAPQWMRRARIEWTYRLMLEPRRMAGRYLVGNARFLVASLRQKLAGRGGPA